MHVCTMANARATIGGPLRSALLFRTSWRATARDLPQALGDAWRGSRGRGVTVATACDDSLERLLTVRQHYHASNNVLQLSNIARPRVLREAGHRLGRELLRPRMLLVEPGEEPRR